MSFVLYKTAKSAQLTGQLPDDFIIEYRSVDSDEGEVPEGFNRIESGAFTALINNNAELMENFSIQKKKLKKEAEEKYGNIQLKEIESKKNLEQQFKEFLAWKELTNTSKKEDPK